jgi:hypothetical protein
MRLPKLGLEFTKRNIAKKGESLGSSLSSYDNMDELQIEIDQNEIKNNLEKGIQSNQGDNQSSYLKIHHERFRTQLPDSVHEEASVPISVSMKDSRNKISFFMKSEQIKTKGLKFYWKSWTHKTIGHVPTAREIESSQRSELIMRFSEMKDPYGFLPQVGSQKQLSMLKNPKATVIKKKVTPKLTPLNCRFF